VRLVGAITRNVDMSQFSRRMALGSESMAFSMSSSVRFLTRSQSVRDVVSVDFALIGSCSLQWLNKRLLFEKLLKQLWFVFHISLNRYFNATGCSFSHFTFY